MASHCLAIWCAQHADGKGIRRSNVGGFHSEEERFNRSSSDWYGRLCTTLTRSRSSTRTLTRTLTNPDEPYCALTNPDEP